MKIDRMTENQLEAVAQLEQRCFSHPWSFNSLEEELNNETSLFFTATEDNAVVGYIGMSVVVDEGYIFNVAVDGTHRNRGIGSALVETLVTYAKKNNLCFLTLEVRESNGNARSLYEKFGFIKVGELLDADAIITDALPPQKYIDYYSRYHIPIYTPDILQQDS